jgi:hypothetical protein
MLFGRPIPMGLIDGFDRCLSVVLPRSREWLGIASRYTLFGWMKGDAIGVDLEDYH